MSGWGPGKMALWGATTALVASAHVAFAAWAMRQPVHGIPDAPAPIEIELAPAEPPAEAADAPAEEPAEVAEAEPEAAPDFTPPEIEPLSPPDMAELLPPPEPEPVPDFVPPPIAPLPPTDFASLLPPPVAKPPKQRPERIVELAKQQEPEPEPEPKRERKKEKREKPKAERKEQPRQAAAEQPRREARSERRGGEARSASQSGGRASKGQVQSWSNTVGKKVRSHMARTKVSGGRGTVTATVAVTVSASGSASGQLVRGTGDSGIDAALQRQAARLPKMPASPTGSSQSFQIPFTIKR